MCPVCMTTFALIASSGTSTGGFAALLIAKKLRANADAKKINPKTQPKGEENGTPENRVTN